MEQEKENKLVDYIIQLTSLLSEKDKIVLIERLSGKSGGVPISIFNSNLSGLEALILYLKENMAKSVKEIAEILNRNVNTIYTTYRNAKRKLEIGLDVSDSIKVPVKIFAERKFSVLESLVHYLKEVEKMKLTEISKKLNKGYSTVKTVYNRHKKKW